MSLEIIDFSDSQQHTAFVLYALFALILTYIGTSPRATGKNQRFQQDLWSRASRVEAADTL